MGYNNAFMEKLRVTVQRERDQAATESADLMKWLCLVNTDNVCKLSKNKADQWLERLTELYDEFTAEAAEDRDLAIERLRRRAENIIGGKVERVD